LVSPILAHPPELQLNSEHSTTNTTYAHMTTVPSKLCMCAHRSCEMSAHKKSWSAHTQNALDTNGH